MDLNQDLQGIVKASGASYFGVADLAPGKEAIVQQGGPEVGKYPYAISIGITLFHPIVDLLPKRMEYAMALDYRRHCYEIINNRLDLIASVVASHIQEKGYKAYPLPAAERITNGGICGEFSHKLGAHLAGLGWIGKSCLLITPDNGPRVRWTSVLTDAPLKPAEKIIANRCGDCNKCVDICPIKAFTGRAFKANEPRETRYDAKKCDEYFKSMEANDQLKVCGLCLYVCPFGKKS